MINARLIAPEPVEGLADLLPGLYTPITTLQDRGFIERRTFAQITGRAVNGLLGRVGSGTGRGTRVPAGFGMTGGAEMAWKEAASLRTIVTSS